MLRSCAKPKWLLESVFAHHARLAGSSGPRLHTRPRGSYAKLPVWFCSGGVPVPPITHTRPLCAATAGAEMVASKSGGEGSASHAPVAGSKEWRPEVPKK